MTREIKTVVNVLYLQLDNIVDGKIANFFLVLFKERRVGNLCLR